jgi:hypothetical protein
MRLIDLIEAGNLDVPTLTVQQLAKKHGTAAVDIEKQIIKGVKHEKEHTTDPKVAREIAMDHIKEDPKYYDKLDKAIPEKGADRE